MRTSAQHKLPRRYRKLNSQKSTDLSKLTFAEVELGCLQAAAFARRTGVRHILPWLLEVRERTHAQGQRNDLKHNPQRVGWGEWKSRHRHQLGYAPRTIDLAMETGGDTRRKPSWRKSTSSNGCQKFRLDIAEYHEQLSTALGWILDFGAGRLSREALVANASLAQRLLDDAECPPPRPRTGTVRTASATGLPHPTSTTS